MMYKAIAGLGFCACLGLLAAAAAEPKYDIAAYYFPGFHHEPRNDSYLGADYTEWKLIKAAKPGFDGHHQPKVPVWGYQDETDPAEMEIKLDAAADHGVNVFIFDWYWYQNKPFLEDCLNKGYLKAKNRERVKFYLMWANHDWLDIFPLGRAGGGGKVFDGKVDRATFDAAVDHVIKDYFSQPSYYKIEGAPVFSIYELGTLIAGLGGMEATKAALDSFRAKTKAAGFPDLHLNGILWGNIPSSINGVPGDTVPTQGKTVAELGFKSLATYTWTHYVGPNGDYEPWAKQGIAAWTRYDADFTTQYYPNVTIGWDTNPRRTNFDANLITNNTANRFAGYLWKAREYLDKHPQRKRLILINSWNEWPEGSTLEPDTVNQFGYLEAVQDVFARDWKNVAAAANGGQATASSAYNQNYPAGGAIDGERVGVDWGKGGGWNDATADAWPDWLQVDFSGKKSIGKVEVFTLHQAYSGYPELAVAKPMGISLNTEAGAVGLTDFKVEYWDGNAWKPVTGGTIAGNTKARRRISFPSVITSKLRVSITGANKQYARITEVEAWGRDARPGCTYSQFAEYDSTAEVDDGSCKTVGLHVSAKRETDLPAAEFLRGDLELPHAGSLDIRVYAPEGRLVLHRSALGGGMLRISRNEFGRGYRWLRISDAKEIRLRRLFIE